MSRTQIDEIGYWEGRPISEMSRDELLEVIRGLAAINRQQEQQTKGWIDIAKLLGCIG